MKRALRIAAADLQDIPCALCGAADTRPILAVERNHLPLHTVACARCGLIFINPRPRPQWFSDFYENHYRFFYEDIETPTPEYAAQPHLAWRHKSNVEFLQPHLPDTGKVLDVGSADGGFLSRFRQAMPRWDVVGVEPNPKFAEFARTHFELPAIHTGEFPAAIDAGSRFDLVHAGHVLEHLLDPNDFFRACRERLDVGGRLFLDVPNADSRRKGISSVHVAHVYYYAPATLAAFLAKWGFEVLAQRDDLVFPFSKRNMPTNLQMLGRKLPDVPEESDLPQVDAAALAVAQRRKWRMSWRRRLKGALRRRRG